MPGTTRQAMHEMLTNRKYTVEDLARTLGLTPREAQEHLGHLKHSLKRKLHMRPAGCRDCGYIFTGRIRLDRPGRCPKCRGQRIKGPWFKAEA